MDLYEKLVSYSDISDLINNLTDEDMDELGVKKDVNDDPEDFYCFKCCLVYGYAKEMLLSFIEGDQFDHDTRALFYLLDNM